MSGQPKPHPLTGKIERAATRLSQLHARNALRQMREEAQNEARQRQLHERRRGMLGDAVMEGGLGEWAADEVLGLVLLARERFGQNDTTRKMLREHAATYRTQPPPLPTR